MYEQTRNEIIALQATSKGIHHFEQNYNNECHDTIHPDNTENKDYVVEDDYHIVKYYGTFSCPEYISIAFEYMAGGSLLNMIEAKHLFTEKDVKVIAYSILTAMKRITELNYIHRNIKVSYY